MHIANKSERVRARRRVKRQVAKALKRSKRELHWENGKLCLFKTQVSTLEIHRIGPKARRPKKSRSWKKMRYPS